MTDAVFIVLPLLMLVGAVLICLRATRVTDNTNSVVDDQHDEAPYQPKPFERFGPTGEDLY